MGFAISFDMTESVSDEMETAILKALESLRAGRTWLSCEPPFLLKYDGVLSGSSKPNFMPHPEDVASAEAEGLPDGTLNDLLDILCELSRQFRVEWEISHDHSDGPVGYIRRGHVDEEVRIQCETFSDLAADLGIEGFDLDDL
jgi:hypothetical protein